MKGAPDPPWTETLATVIGCTYTFGSLSVMAFGLPERNHFLIDFTYQVAGQNHTGRFRSPDPIPQGSIVRVAFNPLDPGQNRRNHKDAL